MDVVRNNMTYPHNSFLKMPFEVVNGISMSAPTLKTGRDGVGTTVTGRPAVKERVRDGSQELVNQSPIPPNPLKSLLLT